MFNIRNNKSAFLAMYLHRLRKMVTNQCDTVFDSWGVTVPSSCTSIFLYLREKESASITELSEYLQYSHQLVSQRLKTLGKQGFVEKLENARDQRKSRIVLSDAGVEQANKLVKLLPLFSESFDQLFDELEVDLAVASERACELLNDVSLNERIQMILDSRSSRVTTPGQI